MAEYKINDNRLEKYSYSYPSIRGDLNVVIPDGVRIIGTRAFESRNIETVVIPDGVEIIESYAFSSCKYLKKVVLPQTLKTIEERAFWRCESLTEVTVSSVIENLDKAKYDIHMIGITKDGEWFLYTGDYKNIMNGEWESDSQNKKKAVISPDAKDRAILVFDGDSISRLHIDVIFNI